MGDIVSCRYRRKRGSNYDPILILDYVSDLSFSASSADYGSVRNFSNGMEGTDPFVTPQAGSVEGFAFVESARASVWSRRGPCTHRLSTCYVLSRVYSSVTHD